MVEDHIGQGETLGKETPEIEGEKPQEKPPWGDKFDAERAWKSLQNTRDELNKAKFESKKLTDRVKQYEDSVKTDHEKLEERATGAEKTAAESVREAARLRVALRKGLNETQAKRLVGDSEEDLETDADELLASFRTEDDEGQEPRRRPRERLRPGAVPSTEPEPVDMNQFVRSAAGR